MAIILPTNISIMKDKYEVFFIELYRINLVTGPLFLAACDQDISFIDPYTEMLVTYKAFPIEREVRKATVDSKLDSTSIKISNYDDSFTLALVSGYDFRGCIVDIFEIAWDTENNQPFPNEYAFIGQWEIDSPFLDEAEATFKVDLKPRLSNILCGRTAMLSCQGEFGDAETCGANKDLTNTIVTAVIDANEFNIGVTKTNDYWKYGLITINNEMRRIKSNVGSKIITEYPFINIPEINDNVIIQRHCNKSFSNCKKAFNNHMNYSGIIGIPTEIRITT